MKHLVIVVVFLLASFNVVAQSQFFDPFQVQDIRVEGNQRVSQGTVFAAMPIQLGDMVTPGILADSADALIRTGFFDDIQFGRDAGVLVVEVVERPAVSEITIEGNKALKSEDLLTNMSDNGLSEGQIFQQAVLEGMTQAVENQYVMQGRYNASVETEIIDLPRNQVKINILIDEGKEARIKHINIIGNEKYTDEELFELFEMTDSGWFTWMNGRDKISTEKLSGDLETLESFYLDRGYLEFSVDSAPISISPDKETFYVTINITEGEIYTVNKIDLSGDLILTEQQIRSVIFLREGNTFSQSLMTSTSEILNNYLGNEGYTFAEARGLTDLNREDKTVDVTFHIDPGKRAYVRRVEFRGNSKTADEVLRREMIQMEGGSARAASIENSVVELERTGFFKEVNVETIEVPGSEDLVDVEYTVEEQPSGAISFTVGYSQGFGASVGASVSDNNWFGSGKQVGFGINYNTYQEDYRFNYNDPYFTPDGVSRGFSVFYSRFNYEDFNVASYSTDRYGANMTFGYPISNIERVNFSLGYSNTQINVGSYAVQEIQSSPQLYDSSFAARHYVTDTYLLSDEWAEILDSMAPLNGDGSANPEFNSLPLASIVGPDLTAFEAGSAVDPNFYDGFIDRNGDSFNAYSGTLSWVQSTLNRGASGLSDRGYMQQASLQVSLPGSDLEYYKFIYEGQYFKPLTWGLTLHLRARLGYAGAYGKTEDVPFFEHFYAGGFGSIRGFERNTLGPRSTPPTYYSTNISASNPFAADLALVAPADSDSDGNIDSFLNVVDEDGRVPDSWAYILCESTCSGSNEGVFRNSLLFRDDDDPFGGNALVETTIEVLFPLPFLKDQRSVQSAFFVDAGSVFDTECGARQRSCFDIGWDGMSASYGIGVTWISGFGPLTFAVSRPIQEQEYDEVEFFQFSLGTQF